MLIEATNPFSTCRTAPERVAYLGVAEEKLTEWVEFWQHHRLAQVVGPHGVGKTTLAVGLSERLCTQLRQRGLAGLAIVRKTLRPRRRSWGQVEVVLHSIRKAGVNHGPLSKIQLLDGLEHLSLLHQSAILRHLRRRGDYILITAHRPLPNIPILTKLSPNVEQLIRVVDQLAPDWLENHQHKAQLVEIYRKSEGNIRECLMTLYDRWEVESNVHGQLGE